MKVTTLKIPDLKMIEPETFKDERGYFFESFNQKKFNQLIGSNISFVQDNQSKSTRGVLRGLHYQNPPFAQGKLVRVIHGEIYDVIVDIRPKSITFGHWVGCFLSEKNNQQIWIPSGFAHGFMVTSLEADVVYKTTDFYSKEYEDVIAYNDCDLSIKWPKNIKKILSPKDLHGMSFKDFKNRSKPRKGFD